MEAAGVQHRRPGPSSADGPGLTALGNAPPKPADRLSFVRSVWRALPADLRFSAAAAFARAGLNPPPPPAPPKTAVSDLLPGPVIVSGFFSDERGVGRAARLTADALERAGFHPVRDDLSPMLQRREPAPLAAIDGGVWIVHCNAPEAAVAMRLREPLARAAMFRIAAWSWELTAAPASWIAASSLFHELWTPSAFVARAFSDSSTAVRVMPHPVVSPAVGRGLAPLAEGARFAALADMRSSAARKNPEAVLRAWLGAFPEPGGSLLTLKLLAPEAEAAVSARLAALARGRPDIVVLEQPLDEPALSALYAATDVVISLHRSEGFGLTLAEAMAAGKCVIATGWSGNLQFMDPADPDQIVPARSVPVHDPGRRYRGGTWAEPDVAAASALIARLAGDAGLRRRAGEANRIRIAQLHHGWSRAALAAQPFSAFASTGR